MGGWELKEASGLCTCSFDPWRPQDNALNGKYLVTWVREYVEIERRKSDSKSILIIYRICNQKRNPARTVLTVRSYVLIQRLLCVSNTKKEKTEYRTGYGPRHRELPLGVHSP